MRTIKNLINPEKKISEEITKLTGIDDDMVKDMPTIGKVIPDFYKAFSIFPLLFPVILL